MRKRTVWSPIMDEYLFQKRMKGQSFASIGSCLGVSGKAARQRFVRAFPDAPGPDVQRVRVHSPETRARVVAMRKNGMSHKQIARELNLGIWQVCGIWNHWRDYTSRKEQAA